jgi:hypothetical protein
MITLSTSNPVTSRRIVPKGVEDSNFTLHRLMECPFGEDAPRI